MATYPRITPATLANLNPAINDPTDDELANLLAQVDLQTRRFVYDFLITKFDTTTEMLKAASLDDASLAGKVKGSTANSAGAQQGIVQGTVSTPDLRDSAVSSAKINDTAVTTAKIADGAVVTTKLADLSVTTIKVADGGVSTIKLANDSVDADKLKDDATGAAGAVTADHLRTNSVTTAKIADNAVTADKIYLGTAIGHILVADSARKFQSVEMSGDATISSAGVVTVSSFGVTSIEEQASNGGAGGASLAGSAAFGTPNIRGSTGVAWTKIFETISGMATLLTLGKIQLTAGTFLIEARCPAYSAGLHLCRIARYNTSDIFQEAIYGSSETSIVGVQSHSIVRAKMTFVASDYFKVEHWTELAKTVNGLGVPTSSGGTFEKYAQIRIQKLSS